MLDIERILAERLNWSLYEMDRTDIESLIPFVLHLSERGAPHRRAAYADEVAWL
jgi:hypothetical protein